MKAPRTVISVLCGATLCAACLLGPIGCTPAPTSSTAASGSSASDALPANDVSASSAVADTSPNASASTASAASATRTGSVDVASIEQAVRAIDANTPLQIGFAYVDLESGRAFDIDGDASQNSASMIKLLILAEFLAQVDAGTHSLDETYIVRQSDLDGVAGTGSLQHSVSAGSQITLGEAARLMISESDNVAANILIEVLGLETIDARGAKLGLSGTHLNRKMFDIPAQMQGIENYTTANDVAAMLSMIYHREFISPEASDFALLALLAQFDVECLVAGLPMGVRCANKTGEVDTARNDGAIVYASHPYVIVALCAVGNDDFYSEEAAKSVMKDLSSTVYNLVESA